MGQKLDKTERKPRQLPQGNVRIVLKSFDVGMLESLVKQILETLERTGARLAGPIPLPTTRRRFIVIRSPHIDKASREYFELRVHKRLLDIVKPAPSTIDALSSLNAPAGVDINIKLSGG